MEKYKESKDTWKQYSSIKSLIEQNFLLKKEKKYEDFIKKLVMILEI